MEKLCNLLVFNIKWTKDTSVSGLLTVFFSPSLDNQTEPVCFSEHTRAACDPVDFPPRNPTAIMHFLIWLPGEGAGKTDVRTTCVALIVSGITQFKETRYCQPGRI